MKTCLIALFLCAASLLPQAMAATPAGDGKSFQETKTEAEKGSAQAQFSLGFMYRDGDGVPKDEAEAVKWFRKAADQGLANAQLNLGFMYYSGNNVVKDENEAYKWFLLAGAQGNEQAKKNISIIERDMTPAQRAEGQRLAREWKPRKP